MAEALWRLGREAGVALPVLRAVRSDSDPLAKRHINAAIAAIESGRAPTRLPQYVRTRWNYDILFGSWEEDFHPDSFLSQSAFDGTQ